MSDRTLKIEARPLYRPGRVKPLIRLGGFWLQKAGFEPGQRVRINLVKPGEMILECLGSSPLEGETAASGGA